MRIEFLCSFIRFCARNLLHFKSKVVDNKQRVFRFFICFFLLDTGMTADSVWCANQSHGPSSVRRKCVIYYPLHMKCTIHAIILYEQGSVALLRGNEYARDLPIPADCRTCEALPAVIYRMVKWLFLWEEHP